MINNSVVIASSAGFLVDMLREKLHDVNFRVYIAGNDKDLFSRINSTFPKFIFIEQCFYNNVTDEYVYKIKRKNQNLHIVIWTASDITPFIAARFIHAGAESFFSLRETGEKIHKILNGIMLGDTYCPDDVTRACNSDITVPIYDIPLTEREIQIIKLLHKPDKQIAKELCIAFRTVCYHKERIFKKLGLKNRSAVISYAIKQGIISSEKTQWGLNYDY